MEEPSDTEIKLTRENSRLRDRIAMLELRLENALAFINTLLHKEKEPNG